MNRIFNLKENNTDIKTEITAGLTTFFTMSYLLVLSPKLLEIAGLNFSVSITVTVLVTFICSLLMAFIANKPFAVAPFLGETAFIAYTITGLLGFSIKTALTAILISGIILLIMTLTNIRTYIVSQIPENIKLSFCVGLGLFFIFISLKDIGIVNFTTKGIPLQIGNFTSLSVLLGFFCFLLIVILSKRGVKAAVLISIVITTILGLISGDVEMPKQVISMPTGISSSFMQLDFSKILNKNFAAILFVIFMLVNIDTAGSIIGLEYNLKNEKPNYKKAMIADSLAVIIAPIFGTTTPGAYLDSMTGISSGGRTGLTAFTVGCMFLLGLLFSPLIMIIPAYAYAPALLYVGILMTSAITKIDFTDISEYATSIFTIAIMIFTYNIGAGIISAFITYPLIKLFSGHKHETNIVVWTMFVISLIFFIIYPYN
ncbi:NCS2 family permease [bacterium]|nr:NCS2 family permease [bacterium]